VVPVAVRMDAVQRWLDRSLNWRPPGAEDGVEFVASPLGFVTFMEVGSMRSRDPAFGDWPAFREREMHVTLMVWERRGGGLPNFARPCFHPLVLVLDSSPAMIAGRETYGFPKLYGRVGITPERCEARTEVWAEEGDGECEPDRLVVGLEKAGAAGEDSWFASLQEAAASIIGEGPAADWGWTEGFEWWWRERIEEPIEEVLEGIPAALARLAGPQDFVFLKQLRDHENGHAASYRAVVRAAVEFSELREVRRLGGDWQLSVPRHRSWRWLGEFGLRSGPVRTLVSARFDFELPLGQTIWASHSQRSLE